MDPSRDARRPGGNRARGDRPAAETRRAPRHPRGLPRAYECDGWHGAARGDGRGGPPPWLRVRRDFGPLRVRDRRWRDDRGTSAVAPRPRPGPQSGTEWLHNPPRDRVRHPGRGRDGLPGRSAERARLRDRIGPLAFHVAGGRTDRADRGGRAEPAREYPRPPDDSTNRLARTDSPRPRRRLQRP